MADYIRVLRRIGRVKGFSPSRDKEISENISLCLDGNSNGLEFMIYDLEGFIKERAEELDSESKELKAQAKKSEGLLRAEVRLVKSNAIRACTERLVASEQITELCSKVQEIFLDVFQWVVPLGRFYKKDEAVGIVCKKITDAKTRRRMLNLITLVTEKKSLLLAQKALSHRRIGEVMAAFEYVEVSPITIGKRHDVKQLDSIYKFM